MQSAADNAAELSISTQLDKQLRAKQKELQGIQDESSLLQVVDGALSESEVALQRMRELALSAAGTALSREDKEAIEQEFRSVMSQLDEISERATFNGAKLLTSDAEPLQLSLLGDDERSTGLLQSVVPKLTSQGLGRQARYESARRGVFLSPLSTGDVSINGVKVRATSAYDDQLSYSHNAGSALAKANAINSVTAFTGVRASVDRNVVRGQEAVRELDLDHGRWLKLNGVKVSGFKVEDKDASHSLQKALNAHISETGVEVSVDEQGQLLFEAVDGRNITLEYSDASVRDALRVVDIFGDPLNLGNTVDPALYRRDGDITNVAYTGTSYSGDFEVIGFTEVLGQTTQDTSGGFTAAQDNVDVVFEVVNPGPIGAATFRVKRESVPLGTSDSPIENYRFNAPGAVTSSNSARVSNNVYSYYNDASTRVLRFTTLQAGTPGANLIQDQPLVNLTLENLDEPSDVVDLGDWRLNDQTYTTLFNSYGINFNVHQGSWSAELPNGSGLSISNGAITSINPAPGHDYSSQPRLMSWNGAHTAEVTIKVVDGGHAIGSYDPTGTANEPKPAVIEVEAFLRNINQTVTRTFSLDRADGRYYVDLNTSGSSGAGGFELYFPVPTNTLSNGVSTSYTRVSDFNLTPTIDTTYYVGNVPREYEVRFTSDGSFTSAVGDGPSATVTAYDLSGGGRSFVSSYNIGEVDLGYYQLLAGGVYEGLQFAMPAPAVRATQELVSSDGNISFSIGSYTGESTTLALEITQAGDLSGSEAAHFKLYDTSQPSVTLETGTLNGSNTVLSNGLRVSASQPFASTASVSPDDPSLPSSYMGLSGSYTGAQRGSFNAQLQEVSAGVFDLAVNWSFADGTSSSTTINNVQPATSLNLGYGLTGSFNASAVGNDPFVDGMSFTGSVNPRNFDVGDRWTVEIESQVKAGDILRVKANPQDLAQDTTWSFTAYAPEWEEDDVVELTYRSNFEPTLYTLTNTLTYPLNDPNAVMGEVKLTGTGSFQTGDEIRVHTRGFVAEAVSSGYYTENLYPTDYYVTVTKGGTIDQAELSWTRSDGRTLTERGGSGTLTNLQANTPLYLEEGVYLTFNDLGQGIYLAEGDQIKIPVGQKLEYTFASQLTLQSRGNIELSYSDNQVDNLLGRMMFLGDETQQDEQGWEELSLQQGLLGASEARSLQSTGLLSLSEVREAVETIDVALAQLSEARATIGATLNRAAHRSAALSEGAASLLLTKGRLEGADVAQETMLMASEQIKLMSAPRLKEVSLSTALRALELVQQGAR